MKAVIPGLNTLHKTKSSEHLKPAAASSDSLHKTKSSEHHKASPAAHTHHQSKSSEHLKPPTADSKTLQKSKSSEQLKATAAKPKHSDPNDPKNPDNKQMYAKKPRVATEIKEEKMNKAFLDAKALASEIRKG